jgi:hypothetical protein
MPPPLDAAVEEGVAAEEARMRALLAQRTGGAEVAAAAAAQLAA